MKIKYINLYNNNNDLVTIKASSLVRNPKVILEESGTINHLALEIKSNSYMLFKRKGEAQRQVTNIKSMKRISGVDFQTNDSRHYFNLLSNKSVDIRTGVNGNLLITVRGKKNI